ncbi:hypothetical protein VTK26DRAFT_7288 [Humicola hyalothermophila]
MPSVFRSDEKLGKKDDDHKPTRRSSIRSQCRAAARLGPRKTLKRLVVTLALGVFVYLFIKNIPTDLPIRDRRRPVYKAQPDRDEVHKPDSMPKLVLDRPIKPPVPDNPSAPTSKYNGPIKFPKLASTLRAISSTGGSSPSNSNVLFAAASLKSVGLLLPMACRMGAEQRNYVHFALTGGTEVDIEELRVVNGIDDSCQVIFHDARPDFAATSATERLKFGVSRALYYIQNYMHPQAMFVDVSGPEEDYFLAAARNRALELGIPLVELPEHAYSTLSWVTKLDSSSLSAWDKVNIDILVHASSGAPGSLIHLLKSLSAADYSAGSIPHLTIELPRDVDRATTEFLKSFEWPPRRFQTRSRSRQLTLRHRIAGDRLTEEESSVRFLESFWPASPRYSHVLVLSPQAQLSPGFFHYLKYAVLEYLYSGVALRQGWDSRLFGISLDLPSTHLDASKPFKPPLGKSSDDHGHADDESLPFLWQAPNSNAALYTGHKWVELHSLVSNLVHHQRHTQQVPAFFTEKLVSKSYPSWLEHALRLCRARGYWSLYPSPPSMGASLATIHNELYRPPEEYEREVGREIRTTRDTETGRSSGAALAGRLADRGGLVAFDKMTLLRWDGATTSLQDLDTAAAEYANEFRRAVGGCDGLAPEDLTPKESMKDLFCMKGD